MPFKETCVGDEKLRVIAARLKEDERTMTSLCEALGLVGSGPRAAAPLSGGGHLGLALRSRAPHRSG